MVVATLQLRELRKRALRFNQICSWWSVAQAGDPSAIDHAALVSWRLARVVTGWLYTPSNSQPHHEPSWLAGLALGVNAVWIALQHGSDQSRQEWLSREMHDIYRDTVTVRSLTPAAEINDMLARQQPALREVLVELGEQLQQSAYTAAEAAPRKKLFPMT